MKRLGDGFGMADGSKFAGFSSEVMSACDGFTVDEVERATFALLKAKSRPHIGDVYDALEKARGASARAKPSHVRSDWNDLTLIVAWLSGNLVRWCDWTAELGEAPEGGDPFVPEGKLQEFAQRAYGRLYRDLDDLIWKARDVGTSLKDLRPFEREMVKRIRHARYHGDQQRFDARLEKLTPAETASRETF